MIGHHVSVQPTILRVMAKQSFVETLRVTTMRYNPCIRTHQNPTYRYNGAIFTYENLNGDRVDYSDEITSAPVYYGGLNGPIFDLECVHQQPQNRS